MLDQVYYTGQDYQKALDWHVATGGGKTLVWIGTWPKPKHNAADAERFEAHFEEKMNEIRLVNRAKWLLISELKMTEPDAHRYIEKQAMDRCVPRRVIAEEILRSDGP